MEGSKNLLGPDIRDLVLYLSPVIQVEGFPQGREVVREDADREELTEDCLLLELSASLECAVEEVGRLDEFSGELGPENPLQERDAGRVGF